MNWYCHSQFFMSAMKKPGMTAGLVVNIKPSFLERTQQTLALTTAELGTFKEGLHRNSQSFLGRFSVLRN
jgi:hypothetical protein